MTREFKKLQTNLKIAIVISKLISRAVGLPTVVLEKLFIPVFKKYYCEDILRILKHICGDIISFKSFEGRLMPVLEKKIEHLEKELKLLYNKTHSLVLRMSDIQQLKRTCAEVSIVLMVAYFEDYLKEKIIIHLNKKPKRALPFLEKQLRISDLKEHGFDLTKKMGSIIAGKISFQNIDETAKIYKLSCGIDIFNKNILLKKAATRLFQTRHLIIHNNGKIDADYIKIVKCSKHELGKRISISKEDLIKFKKVLLGIAGHIERQLE